MENEIELAELKEVYDELWADAKTLIKDMKKSIAVYSYASFITVLLSIVVALSTLVNFITIIAGNGTWLTWFSTIIGIVGVAFTFGYGIKLFQWFRRMEKKYAKLIQMEKNFGDK